MSDTEFRRLFDEWASDPTIARWAAVTVAADRLPALPECPTHAVCPSCREGDGHWTGERYMPTAQSRAANMAAGHDDPHLTKGWCGCLCESCTDKALITDRRHSGCVCAACICGGTGAGVTLSMPRWWEAQP
jgi:hypothetical protein